MAKWPKQPSTPRGAKRALTVLGWCDMLSQMLKHRPGLRWGWRNALALALSGLLLVLFAGLGASLESQEACCPCAAKQVASGQDSAQRPPCCASSDTAVHGELAVQSPQTPQVLGLSTRPTRVVASVAPRPMHALAARVRGPPRDRAYLRHNAWLI